MNDLLATNIVHIFGDEGSRWLSELPAIAGHYEKVWSLEKIRELASPFNYLEVGRRPDGFHAVLKISFPKDNNYVHEVAALGVFNGEGSVRLLKSDIQNHAYLMEAVIPGVQLVDYSQKNIQIAVSLMKRLWKSPPHDATFPTVAYWGRYFDIYGQFTGDKKKIPADLLQEAKKKYFELADTSENSVVLHGDFNFGNILSAQREPYLVIDPKGVTGEPAYETGSLLRNPVNMADAPDLPDVLRARIAILSELLHIDADRIKGWGFSQAVLSAIWALEDGVEGWDKFLKFAEALRRI